MDCQNQNARGLAAANKRAGVGFIMLGFVTKKIKRYEYGRVAGRPVRGHYRRNISTGEVQFILWNAGEQGHEMDFWYKMDKYWWPMFEPFKE